MSSFIILHHTQAESLSLSTGRSSGSSMGNGNQSTSRGVILCGEWICPQTHSTAVCVNMKSVTALPSRPQLDRLANGKAPQHRPSLRSGKLTDEKSALSESSERTLTVSVCLWGLCRLWYAPQCLIGLMRNGKRVRQ